MTSYAVASEAAAAAAAADGDAVENVVADRDLAPLYRCNRTDAACRLL